jgi:preprotein translocase subunit SecD
MASLFGIILVSIIAFGATVISGHSPLLGLDLRGGVEIVEAPHGKFTQAELTEAVSIINERVDHLGVSDSTVERQGNDVVIELPGDKNQTEALKTVGSTAKLYFRPLECNQISAYVAPAKTKGKKSTTTTTTPKSSSKAKSTTKAKASSSTTTAKTKTTSALIGRGPHYRLDASTATTSTTASSSTTSSNTTAGSGTTSTTVGASKAKSSASALPADQAKSLTDACTSASSSSYPDSNPLGNNYATNTVILPASSDSGLQGPGGSKAPERFVLGPATQSGKVFSGSAIKSASVVQPEPTQYAVDATLTSAGNKLFNAMAAVRNAYYQSSANASQPYQALEAIELGGQVISAPAIEESSYAGSVEITGQFTQQQASDLATVLEYGAIPVNMVPSTESTISATLGSASLRAGLYAGLGGIVLVLLYMIAYYRGLGLVVVLGLLIGGGLLYAILTWLSQTKGLALTLEGVTGVIVSIGITVDSYVVYFERLKDEVRKGQTIRASVERGFTRAFRTVLTADLVSFMAALILYIFTVGDVRGFAFTLGLSTLLDVFTAYFFIRPIVILLGRRRSVTESRFLGIARGLGTTSTSRSLAR